MAMSKIMNSTFIDQVVNLDSIVYENCTFNNCELLFTGKGGVGLINNKFIECTWTFSGPAGNTLKFLRILYKDMGTVGKQLVETTFENIKKD